MSEDQQFDLQPYGVSTTKRLTVPEAEDILYKPFFVGDHGMVRLVGYMGGDDAIVRAATAGLGMKGLRRIERGTGSAAGSMNAKEGLAYNGDVSTSDLLEYLISAGKDRAFRKVQLQFHMEMPISFAQQFVPAQRACVNEYSLRYSEALNDFGVPDHFDPVLYNVPEDNRGKVISALEQHHQQDFQDYEKLLRLGLARELARSVLGQGLKTRFYWKMDVWSLLGFVEHLIRREQMDQEGFGDYINILNIIIRSVAPQAQNAYRRVEVDRRFFPNRLEVRPYDAKAVFPSGGESGPFGQSQTKRLTVPALEEILFVKTPSLPPGFVQVSDYVGSDQSITDAARISYGKGTVRKSEDKILLRYLKRHRHETPFHMVHLAFESLVPLFSERQAIRHRTADTNPPLEQYTPTLHFYIPDEDQLRKQSSSNRQGRGELLEETVRKEIVGILSLAAERDKALVGELAALGAPGACARDGIGTNAFMAWTFSQDIRNLGDFLRLRLESHAQFEVQAFAKPIADAMKQLAPECYSAFEDYVLNAVTLSALECSIVGGVLPAFLDEEINLLSTHPNNPGRDTPPSWFIQYNQGWWDTYRDRLHQVGEDPATWISMFLKRGLLKDAVHRDSGLRYVSLPREAQELFEKLRRLLSDAKK